MEISCLTRTGPGIKNCFCLHGIFTGNVSSIWNKYDQCIFIINFEITSVNILNVLGFLLSASKKNEGFAFLICYLLVINVHCFVDLLLFQWSWYMATAPGILLMICSSACDFWKFFFMLFCSSRLTYKKNWQKHTHTIPCFSLKNHRQNFFLSHLFLQFNSKINRGFYFCK